MATRSTAQSIPMNHSSQIRPDTPDAATEMLPRTLAGANLRLTPVPPQRSVADSGYDSELLTSEELTPVALSSRKFFQRKVTSLKPFDKEIPEATQHRFNDLKELFGEPIIQYLTLNRPKCQINYSISTKLMVLGESEASAKPWVVVLCDASIYKYVKRYFNQSLVRQEFQPRETEPDLPSLKVVVCNKPPRRIAATGSVEIFGEPWGDVLPPTLCGTIIQVRGPDFTRIARIGGVVKVVDPSGSAVLYAMTVGHIIDQEQIGDDKPQSDNSDEEDVAEFKSEGGEEEDFFLDGDEEFVIDLSGNEAYETPQQTHTSVTSYRTEQDGPPIASWSKMGHIYTSSYDHQSDLRNLDWALIELDTPSLYRPNLLLIQDNGGQSDLTEVVLKSTVLNEVMVKERIVVLDGKGTIKRGTLSKSPSFLILAPGKTSIDTYTLAMDNGSDIDYGDCGSWVVHHSTGEVYGYVVASDVFREAYVVPLDAAFSDIKEKLMAERVHLPTKREVDALLGEMIDQINLQVTVQYRLYIQWCQSESVELLVGGLVGPTVRFLVPRELLRRRSRTFRDLLERQTGELLSEAIRLPETPVQTMEDFFVWTFSPQPRIDGRTTFSEVVRLGIFAWRYQISALSNQVTDMIRSNLANGNWQLQASIVNDIYEAVPTGSPLREVIRAALGRLPQSSMKDDSRVREEWKATFLKYAQLGWDYCEAGWSGWTSQDYLSGACRFHNHQGVSHQEELFVVGNRCAYAREECFPRWEEERVVEPVVEPVVKPVVEPVVEPVVKPVVKPVVEPVVEPAVVGEKLAKKRLDVLVVGGARKARRRRLKGARPVRVRLWSGEERCGGRESGALQSVWPESAMKGD